MTKSWKYESIDKVLVRFIYLGKIKKERDHNAQVPTKERKSSEQIAQSVSKERHKENL